MDEKFLHEILQNPDFIALSKDLELTKDQILQHKYLILEILEERKLNKFLDIEPIISIGTDGLLYKSYIPSKLGVKKQYFKNVLTQEITKINFKITLNDIDKTPERENIIKYLTQYQDEYKTATKGLYIYGSLGRGKTFISQAIANWLAQKGCTVGFVNTSELISYFKRNFNTNNVDKIINILKSVEYLFIDDIGAESISDWFRDEIFLSILSSRMNNKMPTFYSSNYNIEQLLKIQSMNNKNIYYSKDKALRLIERIKATSIPIKLNGKNYRY